MRGRGKIVTDSKVIFSKTADISEDIAILTDEIEKFEALGVDVEFLYMPHVSGKELVTVMNGLVYEDSVKVEERRLLSGKRVKSGGRGRPKIAKPDNWDEVSAKVLAGYISNHQAWELMELSRGTYYRLKASEAV